MNFTTGLFYLCCALSFLIGSIPVGYLLGRLQGVDLRTSGSGNIGATNAARILGRRTGIVTLVLDVLKGALPTYLGRILFQNSTDLVFDAELAATIMGMLAFFGHCFSPFLRFKGGKGVATGVGVFLVLAPIPGLLALVVFGLTIKLTRYVAVSSMLAAASVPLFIATTQNDSPAYVTLAGIIAASLVIIRHHSNIRRLLAGTEAKMLGEKE